MGSKSQAEVAKFESIKARDIASKNFMCVKSKKIKKEYTFVLLLLSRNQLYKKN